MHPPPSIVSSFVTLLVTIGPVETAVVFASLTAGTRRGERRRLALRSTSIAGLGLLLFAICGNVTLGLLHISLPAFRVAGGLLLFLQALSLTFSGPGLSSISEGERHDAERPGDIAVFPLAFPLIAGPGGLSAAVLLMGRTDGWIEALGVIAMIVVCLGLTYGAVRAAERLVTLLGVTGADVVRRISGVLLSGLAIQFVFDGLERAPFLPSFNYLKMPRQVASRATERRRSGCFSQLATHIVCGRLSFAGSGSSNMLCRAYSNPHAVPPCLIAETNSSRLEFLPLGRRRR